ncbi:MAG: RNA polymerase sigma factor [Pirellula sp.]
MSISSDVLALAKSGDVSSVNSVLEFAIQVSKSQCGRYLSNRADIDDVAQSVAIKVYKHLANCKAENEGQFLGFVAKITRNACYDFYKSAQCRVELIGDFDVPSFINEFEAIDAGELLDQAARACGAVEVVELSMAGHSQSEIGKKLGVTKRVVQSRLERHRKTVQAMVA